LYYMNMDKSSKKQTAAVSLFASRREANAFCKELLDGVPGNSKATESVTVRLRGFLSQTQANRIKIELGDGPDADTIDLRLSPSDCLMILENIVAQLKRPVEKFEFEMLVAFRDDRLSPKAGKTPKQKKKPQA